MAESRVRDNELDQKLQQLEQRLADASQQLTNKMAECEAAQLVVQRFQVTSAL